MVINAYWDNIKFLSVDKTSENYITTVIKEDIEAVMNKGLPFFLLKDITVISKSLPKIIANRLPKIENLMDKVNMEEYLEDNVLKFINNTKCYIPTDKLTIKIEK